MRKLIFNLPEDLMPLKTDKVDTAVKAATPPVEDAKVSAGVYLVELLEIKCHNKNCYWMKGKIILGSSPNFLGRTATKVVKGYASRDKDGLYDLANCFSDGVLHSKTKDYIGDTGFVLVSDTGWITLLPRDYDASFFPNFKLCYKPWVNVKEEVDEYFIKFEIENPL